MAAVHWRHDEIVVADPRTSSVSQTARGCGVSTRSKDSVEVKIGAPGARSAPARTSQKCVDVVRVYDVAPRDSMATLTHVC